MNMGGESFQYDAFGRREAKTVSGTTTNYLYDGMNVAQELAGTTPTANLLSGGIDEVFTRTDASGAGNSLTDALGSTLALTDSSGNTLAQYTYEPFGKTTSTGGSTNSFQYTGRENDGTGIYFHRARYYNPQLQRFISEDPIGFRGGINGYAYVGNGPPNLIDPLGLSGMAGRACGAGSGGGGFTLGIRAPGQTFNQCLVQNARNYSIGGAFDLVAGTSIGTSYAVQVPAGNQFGGLYSALAGSLGDATTWAATQTPDILNSAIGSTTTFGRRTSNILALNLAGKGGLPQALSSSSGGLKSFLGSASKALNLGLDASVKAAIDAGLFGAEIIGCSFYQ
jgi:RHS repeat-associated protein